MGSSILELALVLLIVGLMVSGVIHKGRQMIEQARFQRVMTEVSHYAHNFSQLLERSPSASLKIEQAWTMIPPFQKDGGLSSDQSDSTTEPVLSNGFALKIVNNNHKNYLIVGTSSETNNPPKGFSRNQVHMCQDHIHHPIDVLDEKGQTPAKLDNRHGYALRIEL